ncbi:MAG TPA: branched-chain amino acid ABC transporter permease [Thermodesulfobacteriota bacterium]|nr:branched-chain amino acid ABC transporter permease [Thermodesulfobacteriota bacterium]
MGKKLSPMVVVLITVGLLIVPFGGFSEYFIRLLAIIFLWIGKTGCWNIISGFTGYIDFGAVGYYGIGSYVTALLMSKGHAPFLISILVSGVVSALIALPVGLPTLRLRGAYFGIATLAFAEAMKQIILEFDKTVGVNFFEGPHGITLPIGPKNEFFYYIGFGVMIIVIGIAYWIRRSKLGYALRAIHEAEHAAELSGVDTLRTKVKAYMISAFFLGLIGGVETYWLTYITPHMVFDLLITIQMVVMSLLGGIGTVFGPVVGASFLTIIYELLHRDFPYTYTIIVGFIIVVVVLLMPKGIIGTLQTKRVIQKTRPAE